MTKRRDPLSFSLAIRTIAALIGWKAAAGLTGRAERTVQHWSESDRKGVPTLDQAIALDRAFLEQGGGYAPILESYARQLAVVMAGSTACPIALGEDIARVTRETGEALSLCIQAMQPGASPAIIYRAIQETEEADALLPPLIGRLTSFLPGNGAAQGIMGEI